MEILIAVIVLGALGIVFGVVLAVASEVFFVPIDEKEEAILDALPGANCGACGFPGCSGLAKAISLGEAANNLCAVGGAQVAEKIASIMGQDAIAQEKDVAVVLCQGDCEKSKSKYRYEGIQNGLNEIVFFGGHKACQFACIGCGNCVSACNFDAIHVENGIAVVDSEKCVACGACVKACPKNVISLVPEKKKYQVRCMNKEPGKDVRGKCSIGCIGCGICAKNCPKEAITVESNLARINYDLCISCGICSQKCPTHAIPMQEKDIKLLEKKKVKEMA